MIANEGLPTTANSQPADTAPGAEEEQRVRYWTYQAFSRLVWMQHWSVQFCGLMAAGAVVAAAGLLLAAYFIPPGCTAGTIAGVYYDCALSVPKVPDAEALAALRGIAPTAAAPDDLLRGAIPVWIGVTQYVDATMLVGTMAAASRAKDGAALCMCGADYGIPLRVAAHGGTVMFGAQLESTAGHIEFTFEDSAVARAAGFRPELHGPSDAYVSYRTLSGAVVGEHCDHACAACVLWCDALLDHVTR